MKRVKYSGKRPEYIDGFPSDCNRSCKGAIHLLPGALKDMTEDEIKFIKEQHPEVPLAVLPAEKSRKAVKKKAPAKKMQPKEVEKTEVSSQPKPDEGLLKKKLKKKLR